MQAAAQQRTGAELDDGGLDGAAEARQPHAAARTGDNIGFLDDLAKGAAVTQRVRDRGAADGDREEYPGTVCQRGENR